MHPRSCRRERGTLSGDIDKQPAGLQTIRIALVHRRHAPHGANIDLPRALSSNLCRLATFFLDVCLNHLRCRPRGEVSVFALFQQRANHNLRVLARLHAHKPAVIFEILFPAFAQTRL